MYDVTSAGVFKPSSALYRTEPELNETTWSQDITGDGVVSQGSTSSASDAFADAVGTDVSQEVVDKFQNSSASDILSVKAADGSNELSIFVPTGSGAKSNVDLTVKQVQSVDAPLMAKAVYDTGLTAQVQSRRAKTTDTSYEAVTGLLDTKITVTNQAI